MYSVQHSISHASGNDSRKSICLSFWRNEASDDATLTADGRAFHVCAADTGNAVSPSVEHCRCMVTAVSLLLIVGGLVSVSMTLADRPFPLAAGSRAWNSFREVSL